MKRVTRIRRSSCWVDDVKRIRDKKQPLTAAGVHGLRDEYTRTIAPARESLDPGARPRQPRQPGLCPLPEGG